MFKTESDAQSEFGLKFEIHFWLRSSRLERTQASIRVTGFDKFASIRLIRSKVNWIKVRGNGYDAKDSSRIQKVQILNFRSEEKCFFKRNC